MSAAASQAVEFDPLRNSRFPDARAARDQADWLSSLEFRRLRPRTIDDYCWATDMLLSMFPDKALGDFTDGDLLAALNHFPARSRRARVAAYKSWFSWAVKTDRIDKNPIDKLPDIRREPSQIIEIFTEAEEAALEALPLPDGALMTVLFETGVRKSEARHLQVRHFNLATHELVVREGSKAGKERVIHMTPRLEAAVGSLFLYASLDGTDYLWGHAPGGGRVRHHRACGETSFHRWWERCLKDAQVAYRKPHTTRHTYATRWRERGLALDDIQMLLGHASIATTRDLYVHTEVKDIGRRMDGLLERGK